MLTRTQEEILQRIESIKPYDLFGDEWCVCVMFLNYDNAKKYLKEDTAPDFWVQNENDPIDHIKDYMNFAWNKANTHRGLSSERSIRHMMAWLWLAGKEEELKWVTDEYENNYRNYGKPILRYICERFNLPIEDNEDEIEY